MKNIIPILLISILFLSGCILDYREGLPAGIVISEMPKQELESMACENPPCATIVQMSEIKRSEYVCSPLVKGANDDPQGTTYKTMLGDECTPLPEPTTVCINYNCEFDTEYNIGYYEINVEYSRSKSYFDNGVFTRETYYNDSKGVSFINELPIKYIGKRFNKGSLGEYEKSQGVIYSFYENMFNLNGIFDKIGVDVEGKYYKTNSKLLSAYERDCDADMPLIYPYNAINFEYNPILEEDKFLQDLITDYVYLESQANNYMDPESSQYDDPCKSLCEVSEESLLTPGTETNKQYEDECNACQEEQRKKMKDEMKKSKDSGAGAGGYLYSDLAVKEEGGSMCSGMSPCVEIDRANAKGDGLDETRYFTCQCSCETVIYATYNCSRAGDNTQYFYTSCEKKDIKSDQGGYLFSIHGFEAEMFKNVLGNSENKMPTFMVGQGSTFADYFAAKDKCVPEVTADEIIMTGNEPFTPNEIEIISGSPVCFRNDGLYSRNLYLGVSKTYLATLNSTEGICFSSGPNTNFTIGSHEVYVNDNKVFSKIKIVSPSTTTNILNTIKRNENNEMKFFYNDKIELSLIYASSPFSVPLLDDEKREWGSYDTGEFSLSSHEISKDFSDSKNQLTWVSYKTDVSSMSLSQKSLYNFKYDINLDGKVDIQDLIYCGDYEVHSGIQICSQMVNAYPYFKNLVSGSNDFDYPIINKNVNYYEFNPGAIALPLYSDFCVSNTLNKRVDLVLEKKTLPLNSRTTLSSLFTQSGLIPSLSNVLFQTNYTDGTYPNHIKILSDSKFVYLDQIINNNNYQFVEGKALYQGLECCFTLGEPGVYRVSSLTGELGSGYVVVFPTDINNTIVLNDYEYEPQFAVPSESDFVCIKNPYDFDRELKLSGSKSGTINLGASTETCSYDWALKKGTNILFEDLTTGANFEINVTNSTILNIEVMSSTFIQKTGKVNPEGTICFISSDEMDSVIDVYRIGLNSKVLSFDLEGNSMKCFTDKNIFSKGLYKILISPKDTTLIMPTGGNLYVTVGEDYEGYIYNSTFYGSPLTFHLEGIESLLSSEITLRPDRTIKINNLDNVEYHLYTKISFDNSMGFYGSNFYIQTPEIILENKGNEDLIVSVYNAGNKRDIPVPKKSTKIYNFKEGDTQLELTGKFVSLNDKYSDSDINLNFVGDPVKLALIDSSKMIIAKNDNYIADTSKPFNYEPIKFKNILLFNVSTSNTQTIYYATSSENKLNSFVIDSIVDKKSEIEMQKITGTINNLDFGVQVLNDVPTSEILLDAKKMLAYDQSLPIFMYSRIGNVEVGVDNPSKTEIIYLPKGSEVAYVKSSWLSELLPGLIMPKNGVVTSTDSTIYYGIDGANTLNKDINFTITSSSGIEKIVQVKAVEPSKTVVMNYDEFKVDGDTKSGNKTYIINNLAYEPRAFNLRPNNAESFCIEFNGATNSTVNLLSSTNKTASKMMLYNLSNSNDELALHDSRVGNTLEISDITILPNYGVSVSALVLDRLSIDNEVGYLYLRPEYTTVNPLENVNFDGGFVSGLDQTSYVRAYRFYGSSNQLKVNIAPNVYDSNSYSILARAYSNKNNIPALSKLLEVTNLYLRMKNVKAVPNKWYVSGMAAANFSEIINGKDTYLKSLISNYNSIKEGTGSNWVYSGCGDYMFVVPFNSTHYPLTFAYDVPLNGTSNAAVADYMYTSRVNYPYGIMRVNSSTNNNGIVIYNGEIINDVKMLMSENPDVANEICGYYYVNNSFVQTSDFANRYSGWEFTDDVCNKNDKSDFELDVDSSDFNSIKEPIMIYTPTGMYCGWGGGDGNLGADPRCNGTNGPNCLGTFGLCTSNKNCLETYIGTKEYLQNINSLSCDERYEECTSGCSGFFAAACNSICSNSRLLCKGTIVLSDETNLDKCYSELTQVGKKKCYEKHENSDICLELTLTDILNTNCSVEMVGEPINSHLVSKKDIFLNCINSTALSKEGECKDGYRFDSMDDSNDYDTWWCRYNSDAFGHEAHMFCSGGDCWNYMNVTPMSKISIKNQFDKGVSYNDVIYDFVSGGYFDIYGIDTSVQDDPKGPGQNANICSDRGKDNTILDQFYSSTELTEAGLNENGLTFGLFFMLNSVDTGDYFFKDELTEDYVEKSKGYALSSSFNVNNSQGRKMLCVGAETYNGLDLILSPGGKEKVNLDLSTNYNVYEPAYYTNFVMDADRVFSHVSLFAHKPISEYSLGSFKYEKIMRNGYIDTNPDYSNTEVVNIYLYNLTTQLLGDDGSLSNFDVIDLIQGQTLTLNNTGDSEITWYYASDDICESGFNQLLNDRYNVKCSVNQGLYHVCIRDPTKYSVNPSDISAYLDTLNIEKIIVPAKSSVKVDGSKLIVPGEYGEYVFFNPATGRRFKVIISNEKYVVNIDINTFTQDTVNVFDNENSKLCLRNYDSVQKDIILVSKTSSSTRIEPISPYSEKCFTNEEIKNNYITDSILNRKLNVNLDLYSSSASGNVSEIIKEITLKVVESNEASFNPAYKFLELNEGASATPAIITTEIVDYKTINSYYSSCVPSLLNPCVNLVGGMSDSIANQVYEIVSNSRIVDQSICDGTINLAPEGTICGTEESDDEKDYEQVVNEMYDLSSIDCKDTERYPTKTEQDKCEATKKSVQDKIKEIEEEFNPYTIVNEDKLAVMLPILIKFDAGKTDLTSTDIDNIKKFIDEVNSKVNNLCNIHGDCNNTNKVNDNCDSSKVRVEDRYLDMIGFIVLIDDPGVIKSGNCSFMDNYLKGIMNISSYAASTNITSNNKIIKMGTPSMIIGFGVNRSEVLSSCWTDLEFKNEIESLYKTDFTIMLDKGIIGLGSYCLRDGECLPISSGVQGQDYGLYKSSSFDGWLSFKPIQINPISGIEFENLNDDEKKNCITLNGIYYCNNIIDTSFIGTGLNSNTGINSASFSSPFLNSGLISLPATSSSINTGVNGILGGFSVISFGFELNEFNPPLFIFPGLLSGGLEKEPYGKEWMDRCGRYYYNGEGMTLVIYPEKEVLPGQQGKSCNPGRMMEIYKKFNC